MQGYDKEQVEWLRNYHWNKTTSFWAKCLAVLQGKASIVRKTK